MLPAVPTSKRKKPAFNAPGLKVNSVEPIWSPLEDAPQIWVIAFAPVICWAFNPGSSLPARMLKIRTSRLNTSAKPMVKSPTGSNRWPSKEMIRRFEGSENPKNVNLNTIFVSIHQAKVCGVLERIPHVKVSTYGLISNHISSAPRAVGGAVGSNPWSIFVPCHRVVPSSLTIGNYSLCGALGESGSLAKRKLLMRERVPIHEDRINSVALWNPSEGD